MLRLPEWVTRTKWKHEAEVMKGKLARMVMEPFSRTRDVKVSLTMSNFDVNLQCAFPYRTTRV